MVFYAGCPIAWASTLQSQVALSTTDAEYITMSHALCDVIPIMNLLQKMRGRDFQVICTKSFVYCKAFEDNPGALELTRLRKGLIKIFPIDIKVHITDALTKALAQNDFRFHCRYMCGK